MNAGEHVEHTQMICGEIIGLVNGVLLELERICEEYPEDDDQCTVIV